MSLYNRDRFLDFNLGFMRTLDCLLIRGVGFEQFVNNPPRCGWTRQEEKSRGGFCRKGNMQ